ncbi:Ig-like domain-containing protein [Microbacterium sp. TPU 3598]|uniref:Ig-like domain-containing protein n=1 Tax=Microbacterium sp. TPU 3598 TaxID=1938334 RepID=UPI000BBAB077|nr:Ig-like domain-containing protein [Microbacterium sp. TPU 3598]
MSLKKNRKPYRALVAVGTLGALSLSSLLAVAPASAATPAKVGHPGASVTLNAPFNGIPSQSPLGPIKIVFNLDNGATFKSNQKTVPAQTYQTGNWISSQATATNCVLALSDTQMSCDINYPAQTWPTHSSYRWNPVAVVPVGAAGGTIYNMTTSMTGARNQAALPDAMEAAEAPTVVLSPNADATIAHVGEIITGTASAGYEVVLSTAGEGVVGTGIADDTGNWTIPVSVPLSEGPTIINATAGANTASRSFLVAAAPRAEVVVTTPAAGAELPKKDIVFAGVGEPNAVIEIRNDKGDVLATGTADDQGNWTATLPGPLTTGNHTFTVVDTHKNGPSTQVSYDVAADALKVLSPQADEVIGKSGVVVAGTAEPGETIQVKDGNGTVVATGTADPQGNWSATITGPLSAGAGSLTVTDGLGNTISMPVTVDSDALTVASPAAGTTLGKTGIEFAGTAEPGTTVEIKNSKGEVIASGTANAQGNWTATVAGPLVAGETTVTITAGDKTVERTYIVATDELVISSPAPGATVGKTGVEFAGTAEPGVTIQVKDDDGDVIATGVADAEGNWTATVDRSLPAGSGMFTVTDGERTVVVSGVIIATDDLVITSPAQGATVGKTGVQFAGTAEPGATVQIKDSNGKVIGLATADSEGNWTATIQDKLATGDNTFTITDGEHSFTYDVNAAADELVISTPAKGATVGKTGAEFTGTAEPGATVEIKNANGDVIATGVADAEGNWSATLDGKLPTGDNTFTITDGDQTITFDVTAAADPVVITSPAPGSTIETTVPAFAGTAEPGATVEIRDADGNVIGSGTADSEGNWTAPITGTLPEGATTITVSDGTNDTSYDFTVVKPDAPIQDVVITSPAPGSEISTTDVVFEGTATPGVTVEIKDADGNVIASGTADAEGNWTAPITGTLPEGATTITVSDGTNDTSYDFTVVKPVAPMEDLVITSPTDGSTISTTDVVFEGTANPGATVEIKDADGNVIASATADDQGAWAVTVPGPLPEGKTTLTLTDGTNTVTVEYLVTDDEEGTPMLNSLGGAAAAGLMLGLGALGLRRRKAAEAVA